MKWLRLLVPPEWDLWMLRDRITYFVVTGGIIGLAWLGSREAGQIVQEWVQRLLRQ